MRFATLAAGLAGATLFLSVPALAQDNSPAPDVLGPAVAMDAPPPPAPAPAPAPAPVKPESRRPPERGSGERSRTTVRMAPIFRDVTDEDIADIMAFTAANMPWMQPDLQRMQQAEPDHFRQVCRHLRFEVAQLRELQAHDPEGFRKAIEEKQLRYRAQDLATKARGATDPKERDALVAELRRVVDRLFDVELATRQAQLRQLEQRLSSLRDELKERAAAREQFVAKRVDDMLKSKPEGGQREGPRPDKGEKGERR